MKKIIILPFLFAFLACYSQNDKVLTLDKTLANAAPSCFVKPAQPPPSADSITLKYFDVSNAMTNCIRPCGLIRRYYDCVDTTGKPLAPKCYTSYPPLYILDGAPLAAPNPSGNDGVKVCLNDIERIDILRLAESEALYGIIGKGGAILVITRCVPSGKNL